MSIHLIDLNDILLNEFDCVVDMVLSMELFQPTGVFQIVSVESLERSVSHQILVDQLTAIYRIEKEKSRIFYPKIKCK